MVVLELGVWCSSVFLFVSVARRVKGGNTVTPSTTSYTKLCHLLRQLDGLPSIKKKQTKQTNKLIQRLGLLPACNLTFRSEYVTNNKGYRVD